MNRYAHAPCPDIGQTMADVRSRIPVACTVEVRLVEEGELWLRVQARVPRHPDGYVQFTRLLDPYFSPLEFCEAFMLGYKEAVANGT